MKKKKKKKIVDKNETGYISPPYEQAQALVYIYIIADDQIAYKCTLVF